MRRMAWRIFVGSFKGWIVTRDHVAQALSSILPPTTLASLPSVPPPSHPTPPLHIDLYVPPPPLLHSPHRS
ncbi:hypothetical protein SERLA73DRAFT_182609 [Serpula lacrymans var. lacrymans S7.3]|uniref:Uncharacterized protein n=1 Tax=Serpula lacrymans var. lacrymans (strain S7.3) TaxID=936435 RepID=F8Q0M5_SERL3|nr:hypothetical protein SERLA73DRAFT_182609 [Serpula lacrymans var. lacrymans S7.3]